MLGFIPMLDTATIYRLTGQVDDWGQSQNIKAYTGKCRIEYNTDLRKVSGEDGFTTTMSATVVFHGKVDVSNGDFVEFGTDTGLIGKYQIGDVFYIKDWSGNILATRVVVGNGKRS